MCFYRHGHATNQHSAHTCIAIAFSLDKQGHTCKNTYRHGERERERDFLLANRKQEENYNNAYPNKSRQSKSLIRFCEFEFNW